MGARRAPQPPKPVQSMRQLKPTLRQPIEPVEGGPDKAIRPAAQIMPNSDPTWQI